MAKDSKNTEKTFRQGQQDNSVKLDPTKTPDPKTSITNQDKKITNEDDQKILTDEMDDHGDVAENRDDYPAPSTTPATDIPDIHTPAYHRGKTERELPELNEEE